VIVLIATHWSSAEGGISSFNQALAKALGAVSPGRVACIYLDSNADAVAQEANGLLLIPVPAGESRDRPALDCSAQAMSILADYGITEVSAWIGHDLITGPHALTAARTFGGRSAVIHHMDYLSYQNLHGGRGDETARNHRDQISLFQSADVAFGVGPFLTENAMVLGAKEAWSITPGFPDILIPSFRRHDNVHVICGGRFSKSNQALKQPLLGAKAFAGAVAKASAFIKTLAEPSLTLLGVEADEEKVAIEKTVADIVGRPLNVIACGYDKDPRAFSEHVSRGNLALMLSRHEGFGLIGWEAIGTATPLILTTNSGLAKLLEKTLPSTWKSLVYAVDLSCDPSEAETRVSEAILRFSNDLPEALKRASELREALIAELGCSWEHAAKELLLKLDGKTDLSVKTSAPLTSHLPKTFTTFPLDHFPDCVELSLGAGQGSNAQSLELVTELRFGTTEMEIDGIETTISLKSARLRINTCGGRLEGSRLGDENRPAAGVEAWAGGVWVIKPPDKKVLARKVLGDEALCLIEAEPGQTVKAEVEITAARSDIACKFYKKGREPKPTKERVMEIFLKKAIFKSGTGQVVFSSAKIESEPDAVG